MKPMLAADCDGDISKLRFPLLASPKLDGVRAIITADGVLSRSLKPIPNRHVQEALRDLPQGLDGELIVGEPTHPECYRRTVSVVMSDDKPVDGLAFHIFDVQCAARPFWERYAAIAGLPPLPFVRLVQHISLTREDALASYEEVCLAEGHEGVMVRDPAGLYKHGRATLREGWLTKVKRFRDAEAVCVGVTELMHNDNEAFKNELGRTARSTHRENQRPGGVLGALVLKHSETGLEFNVGTGFTAAERASLWAVRDRLPGTWHKYKFFPTGGKDLPRHPVWGGLRDPIDMQEAA